MSAPHDAIVVGGGVNGLTCAAYLARAGRRPLVLEATDQLGGGARTAEIAPGVRAPILAHSTGPLRADVVRELSLGRHGLELFSTGISVVGLGLDRPPVLLFDSPVQTARALAAVSPRDAEAWPRVVSSLAALGRVIGTLYTATPPDVEATNRGDLWTLLRTLRAFRSLSRPDAYRLLRWGPMAVADLVSELFEHEGLRAAVAADGIFGTRFGPWSAGSGMVLLLRAANEAVAPPRSWYARGGPGAVAAALAGAVRRYGGEVRTSAPVARVLVEEGRACGVVLADGTAIRGRAVVSSLEPKRTLLQLCDPLELAPEFLWRLRNYRTPGTVGKINLALSRLPSLRGVDERALAGRVRIAPDLDYLERAFDSSKYGRYSPHPYIELTIPTLIDPSLSTARLHAASLYVQFAPYDLRDTSWDTERERFANVALDTVEQYAPGFRSSVVAQQVITPLDLERTYGFTGGHIFHGELALDQMLSMRPLLGWGRYRTPIEGLYLCGSGTHPGTGLTGGSGANAARAMLR